MTPFELLEKIHIEILGPGHTPQFKGGRDGEFPIDNLFQVLNGESLGITRKDIFDTALEYGGRKCIPLDEENNGGLCLDIIFYSSGNSELSNKVRKMAPSGKKFTLGSFSDEEQEEVITLCYQEMERTTDPCDANISNYTPAEIVAKWANIFIAPYGGPLGLDAILSEYKK
jgi:hypothetical protein